MNIISFFIISERNSIVSICHIYGAGEYCASAPPPYFPNGKPKDSNYTIAVDGGLSVCQKLNLPVDLIVGDFDSYHEPPPENIETIMLPPVKDDSDMQTAVTQALSRGYDRLHIYGAAGGRTDHTYANIQLLKQISLYSVKRSIGFLFSGTKKRGLQIMSVITDAGMAFPPDYQGYVSAFAIGKAVGVNISGLKYEVEHGEFFDYRPVGLSNEFVGKESMVSVQNGSLLVIWDYTLTA